MSVNSATPSVSAGGAWLALGFRPFFLGAGTFGAVAMALWYRVFTLGLPLPSAGLRPITWHAHEMLFGYALAVVAGFLLTAVRNWTGLQTTRGPALFGLFVCWLAARVLFTAGGESMLGWAGGFDLAFELLLWLAVTRPIVRTKQWANLAVSGKLLLLFAANLLFLFGASGAVKQGLFWGLYTGLYVLLALVFMLARRVLPFFIERGVGYPVQLRNARWIDNASLVLLVIFWLADMLRPDGIVVALTACALLALHLIRLWGWHTPGIWRKPLLWVLYLAYAALTAGFGLKAAVYIFDISPYLAVHAFAVGGIGLMTLGMMTRVALGHTGRDLARPPASLPWLFALLALAALVRVALPLFDVLHYRMWIALSQWLWIAAFSGFVVVYFPILTRPRVDGREG